ncbi:MAG: type II toxin-antitoxin system YoeB family toxin [Syntrophorhabdaceae bacterium]|nr:type II toxin-antitoxin system YoeB family toxin [Syntrophorhabdaceae bacterium]
MYTIVYAPKVLSEDIPALSAVEKARIKQAIEERLTVNLLKIGKPLRYSLKGLKHQRVGRDLRIVYLIEREQVKIVKIGYRCEIYED